MLTKINNVYKIKETKCCMYTLIFLVRTQKLYVPHVTFFKNCNYSKIQNDGFGYYAKSKMVEYSAHFLSKVLYTRSN